MPTTASNRAQKIARDHCCEPFKTDTKLTRATPLMGQFLNLPAEGVKIQCPACGVKEFSQVESNLKWWAEELNRICAFFFVCFCCCCCFNYYKPCKRSDCHHYCKNCGCYFGRVKKHKKTLKQKKNK